MSKHTYIVTDNHGIAVVAPTGYSRRPDGTIYRDGTPSPEMGPRSIAYEFSSHRSAARVAAKLAFPTITESQS